MTTLFEVAAEPVAGLELPELTGTEKQVPWATSVRTRLVQAMHAHLREWRRLLDLWEANPKMDPDRLEREREAYQAAGQALEEIQQERYAGWWLSRRENTARELLSGADPKPGGLRQER